MQKLIAHGVLAAALATTVQAQWPTWRGPSSSGVSLERGLPVAWSETQAVAWKAPLRGLGISSPVVWENLVFLTSQAGSGEVRPGPSLVQGGNPREAGERALAAAGAGNGRVSFVITALDRTTGRQAWEYLLPAEGGLPSVHEKHNLASPSPVTDGERVYAWFATGQIAALDLAGRLVWTKHLGAEYGAFQINWGHGSSPAVYRDMLLLLCYHERTSYLLALDARTGAVRWKVNAAAGVISYSTPLVVETAPGTAEVIVNSSIGLSGHDVRTGERLWHIAEDNRFPIPMPLYQDGVIYTSRGYRSSPFMAVRPGGKGDVSRSHVVWRVPSGAPYVSSLVHYEGLIYMVGDVGVLTVTDARTGARVFQERIGGVYTASPVAADGKIYLVSEDGTTIVLAAGRTPRVLARNTLDARQLASPAISGGRLFIRSDTAVYAIGN
ncbi:MAG: PQQ-binding-like beta-propeller repeat protein [Vicinamibacterales bacterium]